ncbi:hypothetical protein Tco_0847250 [Tanacetum coccineum]
MTTKAQQSALDNALFATENQRVIGKCNMRINHGMKPKEPTYQVVLDALALTTCYHAFLITAEVPVIYMHRFWATVNKHNASYRFKIDNKRFYANVEVFKEILNICPRIPGQEFVEPLSEEESLSFIRELGHSGEIEYITNVIEDLAYQIDNKDSKKQDKMFYPRFTKIIIHHFLEKDKSISMRNRTFMYTARDNSLPGTIRFISRHEDTQVYGAILPKAMTHQAMLDSVAYKTYYAIASGAEPPKLKKTKTKCDSAISSEETPSKKNPTKVKKDVPSTKKPATKPKPTKKKEPVKANKGKSDGTAFQSRVLNEQQRKISGTDEGTGVKPGVPDIPKYDSESDKESWGNSREDDDDDDDDDDEDDTEDDTEDDEDNDDGEDSDGNDDDDNNDYDDDDSDNERTESDRDEIPNLNQFNEEHEEEKEENVYEFTDKEDDVNNANGENEEDLDDGKVLYKDINVNLRKEDVEMTDVNQSRADQHNVSQESGFEQEEEDAHVTLIAVHDTQKTKGPMQSSFVLSDFTKKLLNFENISPADNEIALLMDTIIRHEEPSGQTSTLFTMPMTVIPTTIPPPPCFFNPLPQQATPTPTPTTSEATTLFPTLPDFSSVFKFNDRVTKLETNLSEIKQVDQEEAQAEKQDYIDLVDSSVITIIREEFKTQLPHILPKAVSDFATPVIERNVTESLEAAILAKSSSQPKSTYKAAASLSEYELTKILLDKIEESKSHLRANYKRKLYDALKDKDQDLSAGSDRGTKRRKSSKEAELPKDPRSKEGKSSSSSKGTSRSHHKSSGKSAHADEPSHIVDDSGVQKN